VETLTAELATRAWKLFQEIEAMGGMEAALRAGFPQKSVGAVADEKIKAVARRRDSVVGINNYANPREKKLDIPAVDAQAFHKRRVQQVSSHRTSMEEDASELVLEKLARIVDTRGNEVFESCVEAVSAGATLGEITRAIRISDSPSPPVTPVCMTRLAAGYEKLRDAADRHAGKTGAAPKAFLCTMGSLKEHKARADFSRGFLAAGGFDAIYPSGFKTVAEAAQAFGESGSRLAVLCSTDDLYPTLVPELATALRQARPDAVLVLAGYPQDQIDAHKKSGVDEFIHIRADAFAVLQKLQSLLGIQ
jgi:methylmalonyl-CoA mutase